MTSPHNGEPTLFPVETNANRAGAFVRNDPTPGAGVYTRATDPSTSRKAAKRIRPHAAGQSEKILDALRRRPGATAVEIAAAIPELDRYQVSRRLPVIERDGAIRRGRPRVCREHGTEMLTWWPTEAGGQR